MLAWEQSMVGGLVPYSVCFQHVVWAETPASSDGESEWVIKQISVCFRTLTPGRMVILHFKVAKKCSLSWLFCQSNNSKLRVHSRFFSSPIFFVHICSSEASWRACYEGRSDPTSVLGVRVLAFHLLPQDSLTFVLRCKTNILSNKPVVLRSISTLLVLISIQWVNPVAQACEERHMKFS